jgi:predicted GNAT family N-acyltransferase
MEHHIIEYGSPQYDETLQLRTLILRKPLGLEFTEQQLAEEYADIHLATTDEAGCIVACLILTPKEDGQIKMRQVAVAENVQRKGVGKSLVAYAEEVAKYYGYHKMVLNARENAVPFYLALDYKIEGQPFEEVGIPHSYMTKSLN